jgi:hypothetical protein
VFIAGLTTAVGLRDELEIIVDRRRGGSPTDQPLFERRHRSNVVRALERDGFAIMLRPPTEATECLGLNLSQVPGASPIERLAAETDEQKLERILWSKHRRIIRLSRGLILSGLMNAILVLFLLLPAVKTLISKARSAAPRSSVVVPVQEVSEAPSSTPAPSGAETSSPNPAGRPQLQPERRENPNAGR